MSLNYYFEEEENNREESINNYKYLFLNYENNMPSLNEALNQIFKSAVFDDSKVKSLTDDIIEKCKQAIDPRFNKIKNKYKNVSLDDAYIICSYTCESYDTKYSPYKILNQNLVSNNRKQGVVNISKYLYIFLKSLRKLERYYPINQNRYLYRCISHKVRIEKDPKNDKLIPYVNGIQKTFWGFTSTSINPKMTLNFLGKKNQLKTGTIFTIGGDVWGYDIKLFNYYNEEEILLEPETKFIVDSVLPPVNDVINIICKTLKSPLILDSNEEQPTKIIDNNNIINNKFDNNMLNNYYNNYIVKIEGEIKNNSISSCVRGIGYLCNIPSKNMKILITYNETINLEILNNIQKLKIYINNKEIIIDMNINRYKYTNEELDITIIEILKEDNIITFLEIDGIIDSKDYTNENILAIYFQNENLLTKMNGIILKKNNSNYLCNIESYKNGIIILNNNLKLFGIIKENNDNNLIEFMSMNTIINNINYIKCIHEIKKDDLGKDIQILNNEFFIREKNEEILKKMNAIINGALKSNILTYKFNKEGLYTIYITSNGLIKNMSSMFSFCSSLKEINLSSFNTNQVTDMSYMFSHCSSLKEINLSSFNTNQVTNMSSMFYHCHSLKEINLSSFNTNQVTDMRGMFYDCSSLDELNTNDEKIKKEFKNNKNSCCIIV